VVGNAGAAVEPGLGVAVTAGSIDPVGATDVETDGDAPVEHAERPIANAATAVATKPYRLRPRRSRRAERDAGVWVFTGRLQRFERRARPEESGTPRFEWKEGSSAGRSHRCLPFLTKESIDRGAGDRTYARFSLKRAITVAGLCRSCTGFATQRG
jgi:hypothetical protein